MLVFKKWQVDQEKMFRTTLQISIFKKKRLTKKYDFFLLFVWNKNDTTLNCEGGAQKMTFPIFFPAISSYYFESCFIFQTDF